MNTSIAATGSMPGITRPPEDGSAEPVDEVKVIAYSRAALESEEHRLTGKGGSRVLERMFREWRFIGVIAVAFTLIMDARLRPTTVVTVVSHKDYLRLPARLIAVLLRWRFRDVREVRIPQIRRTG